MQKYYFLLFSILILGCNSYKDYRKNLKLVHSKPFDKYNYYSKLRLKHLKVVDSLKKIYINDTIYMAEIEHSDDCICDLDEVQLNVNHIFLSKKGYNNNFKILDSVNIIHSKIYKFKTIFIKEKPINLKKNDLMSGCLGCGYEHYTAILPNNKVYYGYVYQLDYQKNVIMKKKEEIKEVMDFYKISEKEAFDWLINL